MKKRFLISLLSLLASFLFLPAAAFAWGDFSGNPFRILDEVASEANDENRIQETALDDTSQFQGSYPIQYRITNTLDAIRQQIGPYLQWAFFIGLAAGVILLMFNGLLLVTHSATGKGDLSTIKKNIGNIALGVILLVGVYTIVRLLNAALSWLLS